MSFFVIYKELFSALAIGLTLAAFLPYIRSINRGQTRPHVFSWVIWGGTTSIVFLAQLADKGGVGAWPIGVSGLITLYVAWLAFRKRADLTITRSDWAFFAAAMTSLPLWALTNDPLWAVVILTLVDLLGFGPTFAKAYRHPFEEQLTFFVLMGARNILAAIALEHYSLTTLLFPVAIAAACFAFISMVAARRHAAAGD